MTNTLYYGDNLDILRQHVGDESVDLVYLDPPFNSNASYNVLFKERSGEESPAQIKAFTDTWEWTQESERTYEQEIILNPETPPNVKEMITAFRQFIGSNAMMAYLVMMTPRLVELRRVLKPTGSIYLHCDPTASHYLKLLMDTVFGKERFRNEIQWRRYGAHNDVGQGSRHFGRVHDILLLYAKGKEPTWNQVFTPLDPQYVASTYRYVEPETGKRFTTTPLTGPGGAAKGNPVFEWNGHTRAWRYSKETMERLESEGRLYYSRTGYARQKRYLDESRGVPAQDVWDDIRSLSGGHKERLGYQTQKPQALLERIIEASSNEGDVVLDPFCGCGTAVAAAEKLKRRWVGIDVTHLAVALMKNRLKTAFDIVPGRDYEVVGEPADAGGARTLAEQDRYQFQFWAMSLLEAFPREQSLPRTGYGGKKGADRGIDGVVYFIDGPRRSTQKAIVQVKSGRVSSPLIRDLKGTVEREKAALGLFITLEEPTRDMRTEAVSAGFYRSEVWQRDFPRLQIRTVGELLGGRGFELPPHPSMYQAAQRVERPEGRQAGLEEAG